MANTPTKTSDVKYVNKDFESFKRDLMRYSQAHFPGAFRDYNETSPGMAILEMQAYVGDVLAFYIDQQFMEMKKETARQIENVEAFAKMRGYRPRGKRASTVREKFLLEVPAAGARPDSRFLPVLKAGTQVLGPNGVFFELLDDLDMSKPTSDNNWESVKSKTDANVQVTHFVVRAEGLCISGQTVSEIINVGDFVKYRKVPLSNKDVLDVLSVRDEQGNTWYEVDYLAQNAVLEQSVNTSSDVDTVPYVLRYRSAARRFVVERRVAQDVVDLQFGAADGLQYNDELVPSVSQLALPIAGRTTFTNFALDPQNFLKTSTMGLSPYNTRLLVTYRVGGGAEANVPDGSINKVVTAVFNDFGDRSDPKWADKVAAVKSSIECINLEAATGGGPAETVAEMKVNAESFFAAQNRAVTKDDYLTHVLSIPPKFGRVEKAFIKSNEFNPYAVDLHVLTLDSNGLLCHPTETLQGNIKTYFEKLRMVTEGINILPANVINVGVNFGIVISPQFNRSEVLADCLIALKEYLKLDNMAIGQPVVLSDMKSIVQNIPGVISVYKLSVMSRGGANKDTRYVYSEDVSFDIDGNTKNGIVYCPLDSIFEVRHPDIDIVGESK